MPLNRWTGKASLSPISTVAWRRAVFENLKVGSVAGGRVQNEIGVVGPDRILQGLGDHGRESDAQLFSLTIEKEEKTQTLKSGCLYH